MRGVIVFSEETVERYVQRLVKLAIINQETIYGCYNEVELKAEPTTDWKQLLGFYEGWLARKAWDEVPNAYN